MKPSSSIKKTPCTERFATLAACLLRRLPINLRQVLQFTAVLVASFILVLPSAIASKDKCDCSNLKVLQVELRNALRYQQNFLNKIPDLETLISESSTMEYKKFADGEAKRGIEPIPGYKGPEAFDYDSWGRANIGGIDPSKFSSEKLCSMTVYATLALNATVAASACPGIGEALRAHEDVHVNFCKRIGFKPYEDMHAADRAREEAEAYGAQIKVLRYTISKLRCGYRASGHAGDLDFSGVICDLEKPFTVEGSVINYKFNFFPTSTNSGTFSVSAAGMMVTVAGGGTYQIEGLDSDKPRIAVTGSAVGHAPMATREGSGKFYIDLTPLADAGECGK